MVTVTRAAARVLAIGNFTVPKIKLVRSAPYELCLLQKSSKYVNRRRTFNAFDRPKSILKRAGSVYTPSVATSNTIGSGNSTDDPIQPAIAPSGAVGAGNSTDDPIQPAITSSGAIDDSQGDSRSQEDFSGFDVQDHEEAQQSIHNTSSGLTNGGTAQQTLNDSLIRTRRTRRTSTFAPQSTSSPMPF